MVVITVGTILSTCIFPVVLTNCKSDDTADITGLTTHMLRLEETLSNVQAQSQTLEQKQAAVLSSVLSKLAVTTDELVELKQNYSLLSTELTHVKRNYSSMEDELTTVKRNYTSTQNELTTLRGKYTSTQNELITLQGNYNNLKNELASVNKDLTDKQNLLKGNYTCLKDELDVLRSRVSMNTGISTIQSESHVSAAHLKTLLDTDVAFQVNLNGSGPHSFDTDKVMKFDIVTFNKGNGFNPSKGDFIAPVSGTYIFWVSCVFTGPETSVINIKRNGVTVGFSYGGSPGQGIFGVTSGISVFALNKGHQVHFTPTNTVNVSGGVSTYGGALIHLNV